MNFRSRNASGARTEPDINLIPFIDVLLVVLIFLMLSTTYSKFTEIKLNLPTADVDQAKDRLNEIVVSVSSDGIYSVNKQVVVQSGVLALTNALTQAVGTLKDNKSWIASGKEPVLIISADASAAHQSVIGVMEASRQAGLNQITFAAQKPGMGAK